MDPTHQLKNRHYQVRKKKTYKNIPELNLQEL